MDRCQPKVRSYQDLEVWRKADALADKVFDATAEFPREYLYDLTPQLRKAALSVPNNIAEGTGSGHLSEKLQFFNIARRSVKETEYLVSFAARRGLFRAGQGEQLTALCVEVSKMLSSLMTALKGRRPASSEHSQLPTVNS